MRRPLPLALPAHLAENQNAMRRIVMLMLAELDARLTQLEAGIQEAQSG